MEVTHRLNFFQVSKMIMEQPILSAETSFRRLNKDVCELYNSYYRSCNSIECIITYFSIRANLPDLARFNKKERENWGTGLEHLFPIFL